MRNIGAPLRAFSFFVALTAAASDQTLSQLLAGGTCAVAGNRPCPGSSCSGQCSVSSGPLLLTGNGTATAFQSLVLSGSGADVVRLDVGSPLLLGGSASLTLQRLTIADASFSDISTLQLSGVVLQDRAKFSITNATVNLDCGSWLDLQQAICEGGFMFGSLIVSDGFCLVVVRQVTDPFFLKVSADSISVSVPLMPFGPGSNGGVTWNSVTLPRPSCLPPPPPVRGGLGGPPRSGARPGNPGPGGGPPGGGPPSGGPPGGGPSGSSSGPPGGRPSGGGPPGGGASNAPPSTCSAFSIPMQTIVGGNYSSADLGMLLYNAMTSVPSGQIAYIVLTQPAYMLPTVVGSSIATTGTITVTGGSGRCNKFMQQSDIHCRHLAFVFSLAAAQAFQIRKARCQRSTSTSTAWSLLLERRCL